MNITTFLLSNPSHILSLISEFTLSFQSIVMFSAPIRQTPDITKVIPSHSRHYEGYVQETVSSDGTFWVVFNSSKIRNEALVAPPASHCHLLKPRCYLLQNCEPQVQTHAMFPKCIFSQKRCVPRLLLLLFHFHGIVFRSLGSHNVYVHTECCKASTLQKRLSN